MRPGRDQARPGRPPAHRRRTRRKCRDVGGPPRSSASHSASAPSAPGRSNHERDGRNSTSPCSARSRFSSVPGRKLPYNSPLTWRGNDTMRPRRESSTPAATSARRVRPARVPFVGRDLDPAVRVADQLGVDPGRTQSNAELGQLFGISGSRQSFGGPGEWLDVGRCRRTQHRVHHAGQADLRGDALQHDHLAVAGGDHVSLALATHHESQHLAAQIAPPPTALQRTVRSAEGVDHGRHLRVHRTVDVHDALCGEVPPDLVPHHVAQVQLWDVRADSQ